MGLKVWIDQDLCTGDGLCTDHCPEVFVLLEDGIAYVCEGDEVLNDPGQAAGLAAVPPHLEKVVIESAEHCPGECIFVEVELEVPLSTGAAGATGPEATSAQASQATDSVHGANGAHGARAGKR